MILAPDQPPPRAAWLSATASFRLALQGWPMARASQLGATPNSKYARHSTLGLLGIHQRMLGDRRALVAKDDAEPVIVTLRQTIRAGG